MLVSNRCGPCRAEIPDLKELRQEYTNEQLAILAISDEDSQLLKNFVREQNIPYTVLQSSRLPDPFSRVNALPSTFFIDPQGNIKLATVGMLDKQTTIKILKAQWED